MNGYNFTERVRAILAVARGLALENNDEFVDTDHILLGLLRHEDGIKPGVAIAILMNRGIDVDELGADIRKQMPRGTGALTHRDLPYTAGAKRVLEGAMAVAREMEHNYVGTEHLLLGLIGESEGLAAKALTKAGLTVDGARAETILILGRPIKPS